MLFSVLIPVYNVEKYLNECVDSVLNQNESDLEIILCNDGSTDNSGSICDEYAKKYPNIIKVIHKDNEGLLLTRRHLLKASKGEWIVHLDSDDYMLPNMLSTLKETILADKNLDLLLFKVIFGNSNPQDFTRVSPLPFIDRQIFQGENKTLLYKQLCLSKYFNQIYMKVAKREIIDIDFDYYSFPKIYKAEDKLQSLPLLDNCKKAIFLDKAFIYYRDNEDSISHIINYLKLLKQVNSLIFIWKQCEIYGRKWNFSENEIKLLHVIILKRIVVITKKVCLNSCYSQYKEFITQLSKNNEILDFYNNYDKTKLGFFSKIYYKLFYKNNYFLLYLFIKIFSKRKLNLK